MTDTIMDDVIDGVFQETETLAEPNVWAGIFSSETERQSSFWFCEFSFPLGSTEGSDKVRMVREVVAASSKGRILEFLAETVFNSEIQASTGFSYSMEDYTGDESQFVSSAIQAFFSEPGRNLYVSLVPVL